ncbi:helix-turn-helix domain-containing protein [Catenuloplanes atrovinosus]|uniref:Transcriptional regulator with XRE-family HTH domain n=1 Tax=Catenuloplanes atrovinosus TaxID=137266 RepID=A0AAE3YP03_9ACTN|nr:helix-turn-helix domain-containing protein [Catenuloplanes atrovinosus]MDR7276532.1 transcriptional regulator with XRE-family HTH domain [Catenuloplanes atrovinosus]
MHPPPLAVLIRAHRHAARLTLHELSAASGISVRALGDLERGQSTARDRTLDALAGALGLGADDRAVLTEAAAVARAVPEDAFALPRAVPDFTGRTEPAELLARAVRDGAPVIVHGMAGVGKTALVVHTVSRTAGRFPGGVSFLDCRGTRPSRSGAEAGGAVDVAGRLRRTLAAGARGRRLIVLDDVAGDLPPEPPRAGAALVITSRSPLPGIDGAVRIPLGPLPAGESVALLAAITGAPADAAMAAVADYCGHLPLALRIAGNRLTGRPGGTAAHLADRLADEDRRLAVLSAGDLSVEAALATSFGRLSAHARSVIHRLAHAPGQVPAEASPAIEELRGAGLLAPAADGRYRLHDLVRIAARRLGP